MIETDWKCPEYQIPATFSFLFSPVRSRHKQNVESDPNPFQNFDFWPRHSRCDEDQKKKKSQTQITFNLEAFICGAKSERPLFSLRLWLLIFLLLLTLLLKIGQCNLDADWWGDKHSDPTFQFLSFTICTMREESRGLTIEEEKCLSCYR